MAIPRSTNRTSVSVSAGMRPLGTVTFPSVPANSSVVMSIQLPRSFKPNSLCDIVFTAQLPTGVSYGDVVVSGNSPTSGATPAFYSANIKLTNNTAGAITPTAQIIYLYQL